MKYLLLSLLVLSTSVYAADAKKTASTTPKGTMDVNPTSKTESVSEETPLVMDKNVKADVTCKAKDGHTLKQGEAGYAECLEKVKKDKHGKEADVKVNFKK